MASVLPRALEMQTSIDTHFHIAPSELNTPTPNNASISFCILGPDKDLLNIFLCAVEMTEETFLIVIEVSCEDELKVFELIGNTEK